MSNLEQTIKTMGNQIQALQAQCTGLQTQIQQNLAGQTATNTTLAKDTSDLSEEVQINVKFQAAFNTQVMNMVTANQSGLTSLKN